MEWFTLPRLCTSPQDICVCSLSYRIAYFVFAPCICHPQHPLCLLYWITSSLNSLPPFHLPVTFITHSDSPLTSLCVSICPSKTCPDFCCQPTSLVVISYFGVWNYCFLWPPFLLTFGQHLLFGKLLSLMKQYTCCFFFSQFLGCTTLYVMPVSIPIPPVFCNVQNAKWTTTTTKNNNTWTLCKIIMKWGEKCSVGLNGTSNSKCDP